MEALQAALGSPVRLASAEEVADVFRDCEWGVAAPFGTRYGLQTLLEESLEPDALIILEVNNRVEAIRLRVADFERVERPRRLRFAR